jgi:predicted tellurium resistance membrane protein TerC
VLVRRAQVARLAMLGQRVGYLLYLAAIVLFVIGFSVGLTGPIVTAVVVCLAVGSAALAPAIIAGYAVRAAEKEDRAAGRPVLTDAPRRRPPA